MTAIVVRITNVLVASLLGIIVGVAAWFFAQSRSFLSSPSLSTMQDIVHDVIRETRARVEVVPEEDSFVLQGWGLPMYRQYLHNLGEEPWLRREEIEKTNQVISERLEEEYQQFLSEFSKEDREIFENGCKSSEQHPSRQGSPNLRGMPALFSSWIKKRRGGVEGVLGEGELAVVREGIRRGVDEYLDSLGLPTAFRTIPNSKSGQQQGKGGGGGGWGGGGVADGVWMELSVAMHRNCSTAHRFSGSKEMIWGSLMVRRGKEAGKISVLDARGPKTPFESDGTRLELVAGQMLLLPAWAAWEVLPTTSGDGEKEDDAIRLSIDFLIHAPWAPTSNDPHDPCYGPRSFPNGTCTQPYGVQMLRIHDVRSGKELPPPQKFGRGKK